MRIYVSTAFAQVRVAGAVMRALEAAGHVITCDWTVYDTEGPPRDDPGVVAELETRGIRTADAMLVLLPGFIGTHVELGKASILGVPVILVGMGALIYGPDYPNHHPHSAQCPFYFDENVYRFTHEVRMPIGDEPEQLLEFVNMATMTVHRYQAIAERLAAGKASLDQGEPSAILRRRATRA